MLVSAAPFNLSAESQLLLSEYHRACLELMTSQWNFRQGMQQIDREYYRELDWTDAGLKARNANRAGNSQYYQNLTYPIVMPQVETSVTYQTSVFLTGTPLFGVVGDPKYQDAAMQMETIIDSQAIRGGWKGQLVNHFRNGFKYNLAAAEVAWETTKTYSVSSDVEATRGNKGSRSELIHSGNVVRNLDMYNTYFDPRMHPLAISTEGEFAGYTKLYTRIGLKSFLDSLPYRIEANIAKAYAAPALGYGTNDANQYSLYFVPQLNPETLINVVQAGETNWASWLLASNANKGISYNGLYEVSVEYRRIVPSDFKMGVPANDAIQIWKFILVNHQILVYAERLTNAHDKLPIIFSVPNDDGLMYQAKSVATNASPFQAVATTMLNANIAARRRAITDRVLYDPSRITEAVINSSNPSAKMPVRPAAYGKPVSDAVYAFPFNDNQAGILMQEMSSVNALADIINGHNKAQQGQFVKGNKTRHEYDDVMRHASGRDQTVSIVLEDHFFTPMKEILKYNILQYQDVESLYNRATKKNVQIDPVALRAAALEFKVSDGLVPTDKLIDAESLQVALQVFGSSPQLAAEYDVAGLTSYMLKTRGAEISEFEIPKEQVAYNQAMQQWQNMAAQMIEMLKIATKVAVDMPLEQVIKMIKEAVPPQPKPQDYGYNPNPSAPQQQPSAIDAIISQAGLV